MKKLSIKKRKEISRYLWEEWVGPVAFFLIVSIFIINTILGLDRVFEIFINLINP